MSRVGKKPIKLVSGVSAEVQDRAITIKGKLGELKHNLPPSIDCEVKNNEILLINKEVEDRKSRSLHGMTRSLINNMVYGVHSGYQKNLELHGVGYRASVQGNSLNLSLGFSHPVIFELPKGVQAAVEANTKISLKSSDKELLGLISSKLRKIKPPEPYKGKGIRYQGEVISLKQGKAAGSGGK